MTVALPLCFCFVFLSFQQVQTLLQQMVREKLLSTYLSFNLVPVNSTSFNFFFVSRLQQDKFQQMSDQIITRNILYII